MARLLVVAAVAAGIFLPWPASAHKPSDSYLSLAVDEREVKGRWDIALHDLEYAIGLDGDGDGAITWGEVKAKHPEIAAYALARLALSSGGLACATSPVGHQIDEHSDGAYAVLRFAADCAGPIGALWTAPGGVHADGTGVRDRLGAVGYGAATPLQMTGARAEARPTSRSDRFTRPDASRPASSG